MNKSKQDTEVFDERLAVASEELEIPEGTAPKEEGGTE